MTERAVDVERVRYHAAAAHDAIWRAGIALTRGDRATHDAALAEADAHDEARELLLLAGWTPNPPPPLDVRWIHRHLPHPPCCTCPPAPCHDYPPDVCDECPWCVHGCPRPDACCGGPWGKAEGGP